MDTLLTGDIWKQVRAIARDAERRMVAVAYVTKDGIGLKRNDVLICDASDETIRSGATSASLLKTLYQKGVELRSRSDLHAKAAIVGRRAIVGSCNLSVSSAGTLTEVALLSDRMQVVAQTAAFIHSLRESSEEIDNEFLRRILNIKVLITQQTQRKRKRRDKLFGSKIWLTSVRELPDERFPEEQQFVEKAEKEALSLVADKDSAISWIRWTGKSKFRDEAQVGDMLIQIWTSLSGKRTTVYAPCPIVLRQDEKDWTRLYVSESNDIKGMSWSRFSKLAKKVGLSRVTKDSVREINARASLLIEGLWKGITELRVQPDQPPLCSSWRVSAMLARDQPYKEDAQ